MQLDIIVSTYNRSASLLRTVKSLLTTPVPDGHQVRVVVADNRSTDDTRSVVERLVHASNGRVLHVDANQRQGKSFAMNAGIQASNAELIGFIDDDEELEPNWYEVAFSALSDPSVDYIGGTCDAVWPIEPPSWMFHPRMLACLAGVVDVGKVPRRFTEEGFSCPLLGGNCVIRRACFDKVGLYNTLLGRVLNVGSAEDSEMHSRLLLTGFNGFYRPDLVIRHHIEASRMTKSYARRWFFFDGVSEGYNFRFDVPEGPKWFGLPRYIYGSGLRMPQRWIGARLRSESAADAFMKEVGLWRFFGILHGRYWKSFRADG